MEYHVLSRDFGTIMPKDQFCVSILKAGDRDAAWLKIEESIANTNTQDWLLSQDEILKLKEVINAYCNRNFGRKS
jgi:hypothetical protein